MRRKQNWVVRTYRVPTEGAKTREHWGPESSLSPEINYQHTNEELERTGVTSSTTTHRLPSLLIKNSISVQGEPS